MNFDISIDGADELGRAFAQAAATADVSLAPTVLEQGEALGRTWRSNARKTAPPHGKRYPSSITAELTLYAGALDADVGPDTSKPQGGMGRGFEYGSANQPPHMDGARAFAVHAPKFEHAVSDRVGRLMDQLFG